jgi:hypothetical protein
VIGSLFGLGLLVSVWMVAGAFFILRMFPYGVGVCRLLGSESSIAVCAVSSF